MNPNYVAGLNSQQRLLQQRAISKSQSDFKKTGLVKDRPKVSDAPTPRSSHVIKFEKKYGYSVTDIPRVKREFPNVKVDKILARGAAAYATSGSRPNVSSFAWRMARLASALTGGKAAKIDKDLLM